MSHPHHPHFLPPASYQMSCCTLLLLLVVLWCLDGLIIYIIAVVHVVYGRLAASTIFSKKTNEKRTRKAHSIVERCTQTGTSMLPVQSRKYHHLSNSGWKKVWTSSCTPSEPPRHGKGRKPETRPGNVDGQDDHPQRLLVDDGVRRFSPSQTCCNRR